MWAAFAMLQATSKSVAAAAACAVLVVTNNVDQLDALQLQWHTDQPGFVLFVV